MSRTKTTHVEDLTMYKIRSGHGMNFVCCDCGLVHRMWLKASGKSWLEFMCLRDNRSTAARRRAKALAKVAAAIRAAMKEECNDKGMGSA